MSINFLFKNPIEAASSVVVECLQQPEGVKELVLSPFLIGLNLLDWTFNGLSARAIELKNCFSHTGYLIDCIALPKQMTKLSHSFGELVWSIKQGSPSEIGKKTTQLFVDSTYSASAVAEGVEIANQDHLLLLSPVQLKILNVIGFLGSLVLLVVGMQEVKKELTILSNPTVSQEQHTLALLHLVAKICLVTTSLFGMITCFYGIGVLSHALILSVSTTLLIFSMLSFLYERMVEKNALVVKSKS